MAQKFLFILLISLYFFQFSQQVAFPTQYYPDPVSTTPRLYIKNDITRLQAVYNDPNNKASQDFKKELGKLMTYTNANQDWRCDSGWPAAALALAWRLSGDPSYGTKAINTYLPFFDGQPHIIGRLQSATHYAYAYDWLQGHPDFTSTVKTTLRNKLISWSNSEYASDEKCCSYIAQDSDHLTASTTTHFIAGVAIYGDDNTNAIKMMDRGWTGYIVGFNNNQATLPNVSIEHMYYVTSNGHPLPGWDYNWMSDGWDLQNLFYCLDELGYVNPDLKSWWPNAIVNFIHNIDPSNTHYRWLGDTQSGVILQDSSYFIRSWYSNCIFMADRYGYQTEAAWGRYFLDHLGAPSWGVSDGDPMLWMVRSYSSSDQRIDGTTSTTNPLPRYLIGGIGSDQRNGFGYFRSGWGNTSTWGGFAGVGNYLVDHMHAIHGHFFLWRNGEYLTTDPHNYGGETVGEIYNSLAIPNSINYDFGGPIWYYNEGAAYLERGRTLQSSGSTDDLFYSMLNADHSYNNPDNQWNNCKTCLAPVKSYRRHFLFDGGDYAFTIDRVVLKVANWTAWRYRTQNSEIAPTFISSNLLSVPSDKGNYRTLIKILSPSSFTLSSFDETQHWKSTVPNWQIDPTMWGYSIRATAPSSTIHNWISVMQIGSKSSGTNQLDTSSLISSTSGLIGAFAGKTVFVANSVDTSLLGGSLFSYTTPSATVATARHVIADIQPGCYQVSASIDGSALVSVVGEDNSLIFYAKSGGSQQFSISSSTGCVNSIGTFTGGVVLPSSSSSPVPQSGSNSKSLSSSPLIRTSSSSSPTKSFISRESSSLTPSKSFISRESSSSSPSRIRNGASHSSTSSPHELRSHSSTSSPIRNGASHSSTPSPHERRSHSATPSNHNNENFSSSSESDNNNNNSNQNVSSDNNNQSSNNNNNNSSSASHDFDRSVYAFILIVSCFFFF